MTGGPLRRGCRWLTMFPSVDSVRRQIRAMPPETRWSAEAVQLLLSRARTAELEHVLAA
jgi:hypothetical protein